MSSYTFGKDKVCAWIRGRFHAGASVLDVGACDGLWRRLLPEYENMDAVEIFKPNADKLTGYREVFCADIRTFTYDRYDLVIFGDVIEHMEVREARKVLTYAGMRCTDMIVAVPFRYRQGILYGNPWEVHVQDDLTPELFAQRYPGFEVLCDTGRNYCYYHKGGGV